MMERCPNAPAKSARACEVDLGFATVAICLSWWKAPRETRQFIWSCDGKLWLSLLAPPR
jgi:hypothetical protein